MENWDEPAVDTAVAGLARNASAQEIFELFCRYGARDFRELGHKAIYVANSWRALQCIGWQHAEPVLRSLAYALVDRTGDGNPAGAISPPTVRAATIWNCASKSAPTGWRANRARRQLRICCKRCGKVRAGPQATKLWS